jgi:hypothetical protein
MPTPVAIDGDTKAETSTAKHSSDTNKTGAWQLVKLTVIKGTKVSVGNNMVEVSATASWTYTGGTAGAPPSGPVAVPPIPDSAVLKANPTKLQDAGKNILLDGDEIAGAVDGGNKIVVTSSQTKLSTD